MARRAADKELLVHINVTLQDLILYLPTGYEGLRSSLQNAQISAKGALGQLLAELELQK